VQLSDGTLVYPEPILGGLSKSPTRYEIDWEQNARLAQREVSVQPMGRVAHRHLSRCLGCALCVQAALTTLDTGST
jgi:hypothetical protein